MAAPFMGAVGIGSSILGGGTSFAGALMKGRSSSAQYGYQAGVAEMNARIAKQNADYALMAGGVERRRSGMKTGQEIGQQRAAQGASGLDVNFGSPTQVRESQHMVGMEDQARITENAGRKAYGYKVEEASQKASAANLRSAASSARTASYLEGFGSILGTASSVSAKWLQGQQAGMWGGGGQNTILGPAISYDENV